VNNETLIPAVRKRLNDVGYPTDVELIPVPGGGNNRGYEVRSKNESLFLKVYFQHPNDRRDRLGAEYAFTRHAWDRGLRCIPQPFAMDRDQGFALYEFVRGKKIAPQEVKMDAVLQAIRFFKGLNASGPVDLPNASESCFSVEDHLACVERRVTRLDQVTAVTPIDAEACRFIQEQLRPRWDQCSASIREQLTSSELSQAAVPCISPSDFGFHNALQESNGRFRFIDFEYAGLDDAAKMVCDFFCQVAVPVPLTFLDNFVAMTIDPLPDAAACRKRIQLLLPAYRIKWCCIILNDFLPTDSMRRRFAGQEANEEIRKRNQLDKAMAKLAALETGGTL
jgi:hypothetical protein